MSVSLASNQAVEAAAKAGFDINLIECNLALTPEERLRQHDSALELAQELRKAGELHRAQSSFVTPATR